MLSASAGWGLSVFPSCATQLSHTAVLHSVLLFWHTTPSTCVCAQLRIISMEMRLFMQCVPARASSRTLSLISTTADYHLSQITTIRASSSFCLCIHKESLFSMRIWSLSIQRTNLRSPLPLSAPSTSGWALQLPRALHCKQPLCCHPPVTQAVGSSGCFH